MPTEDVKSDVAPEEDATPKTDDGIDWEVIHKTPHFQSIIADYNKRAKAAEAALAEQAKAQAKAEDEKLAQQAEWQKLAEKREKEAAEALAQLAEERRQRQHDTKRRAVEDAARQHEPAFVPEAIPVLLRMVELDELPDDDTLPKAVQDAVKALAKANLYMLQTARTDPGSPPGRKPAGGAGKPTGTGKPMGL